MQKFKLFIVLFLSSFVLAIISYELVNLFQEHPLILVPLIRAFEKHIYYRHYPYQYIALICLVYSLIATRLSSFLLKLSWYKKYILIIWILLLTVIISSFFAGILRAIHDMMAWRFPSWQLFIDHIRFGATHWIVLWWTVAIFSIPYNIITLIIGILLTTGISFQAIADRQQSTGSNSENLEHQ